MGLSDNLGLYPTTFCGIIQFVAGHGVALCGSAC